MVKGDKEFSLEQNGKIIRSVHYLLLLALSIVTGYSVYVGSRSIFFFVLLSALFVTSILIGLDRTRDTGKILLLTGVLLAVSIPTAIFVGNHFYPYNSFGSEPILQTGNLSSYEQSASALGVYYFIPIETLINTFLALIIGQSIIVPYISTTAILIATVVGLFSLLRKLNYGNLAAIIGVFFLVSIPSLTIIGRMPLVYTIFYILLLVMLYKSPSASVLCVWLISLPMIFEHPSGFIAIALLLVPMTLLGIRNWPEPGLNSRKIRLCLLTTSVVTFAYWTYTYLLALMTNQGLKFYSTILSYFNGITATGVGGNYVPLYYSASYSAFAYAWAIPVALSTALLISVMLGYLIKKKPTSNQILLFFSAFIGVVIIFAAYLSYPGGETGQYLIPVGYFLLLLSSSCVAATVLSQSKKGLIMLSVVLLAAFVLIGTYSPDWAPLEHTDFGTAATINPYHVYLEVESLTPILPKNATIYYDYDLPLQAGSYKPVRNIIVQVSSGVNATEFTMPPVTLFGVRNERFSANSTIEQLSAVYSSGYHTIFALQQPR
jgi:hypothetical protein